MGAAAPLRLLSVLGLIIFLQVSNMSRKILHISILYANIISPIESYQHLLILLVPFQYLFAAHC